jgi:hypothetical protein
MNLPLSTARAQKPDAGIRKDMGDRILFPRLQIPAMSISSG